MEFPYTKVLYFLKHQKESRLLPWARIGIYNPKNPEKVIYLLRLINSGADLTMINREIGENLDYTIENGQETELKGLGGGTILGYFHKVGYLIEDPDSPKNNIKYLGCAAFTKNIFPNSYPQQTAIFGTIDFFSNLMVTFIYPKKIVIGTVFS